MVGIRSVGAYVPKYRLGKETVGWQSPGEKAVANFDEDSITMAVAAGIDCLSGIDRSEVDSILFATTTPPYLEKQNAAIIAAALDLRKDIVSADVTGVLRAGTTALGMAIDAVNSGAARNVLVIAADTRVATPRDSIEPNIGDGAARAARLKDNAAAEIEASHHVTESVLDVWRARDDNFIRSWEDRFVIEEGFLRVVPEAVSAFDKEQPHYSGLQERSTTQRRPPARRNGAQAGCRRAGPEPDVWGGRQYRRCLPYLAPVAALEEAAPATAFSWRATVTAVTSFGQGATPSRRRSTGTAASRPTSSRRAAQDLRRVQPVARADDDSSRASSAADASVRLRSRRETDKNIRLYGARCKACGYLSIRATRLREVPDQGRVRKRAPFDRPEVFTYSMDYVAGTPDVPLVVTVILRGRRPDDLLMTDRDVDQVKIGLPVQMTFRELYTAGGVHNYYWKSMPIRA
jgi:uncharacterized OB-fold protein